MSNYTSRLTFNDNFYRGYKIAKFYLEFYDSLMGLLIILIIEYYKAV